MSYRRITKLLNKNGIKTHTGKEWGETGNSVYSVLKKYRLREERLQLLNKEYELEWGTMEVKWEKKQRKLFTTSLEDYFLSMSINQANWLF